MDVGFVVGNKDDYRLSQFAEKIDAIFLPFGIERFRDGEALPKIDFGSYNVKAENVLMISRNIRFSTVPAYYTLNNMFLLDTIKRRNPDRLIFFPTYNHYGRQNEEFVEGQAWSLKTVAKLYEACGITDLITINSHLYGKEKQDLQSFFESASVHDLSPAKAFAGYLKTHNLVGEDPVIVGPDKGAMKMVKSLADCFEKSDYMCFVQERDPRTRKKEIVEVPSDISKVRGRDVIVDDDVATSGKTFFDVLEEIKRYKPKTVRVAIAHIMGLGVTKRLMDLGVDSVLTTNSFITPPRSKLDEYTKNYMQEVDVMPMSAKYINNL